MEFEPSSSVGTIYANAQHRAGGRSPSTQAGSSMGMSTSSVTDAGGSCQRGNAQHRYEYDLEETAGIVSPPHSSSPRSSAALPSPPVSPSSDSLSSLPSASVSVSSSFFFSSDAASPRGLYAASSNSLPHSDHQYDDDDFDRYGAPTAGLIIPSLTLPAALRSPTAFGQTLGEVSVLLVGPKGSGKTALAEYIVDAEDVVDVSAWEKLPGRDGADGGGGGKLLRASTDWLEERDAHGLERFEGTKNVVVVELNGFERSESTERVIQTTLKHLHGLFYDVEAQISRSPSSPLLHSLLSSSHTILYTALVYVAPFPLTPQDHKIINALNIVVPVIPLCLPSTPGVPIGRQMLAHNHVQPVDHHSENLASYQPRTVSALRAGIFRSPQTLAGLRLDAADRYMRWREVERAYDGKLASELAASERAVSTWNKVEWEVSLSEDYASHLRALAKVQNVLGDDFERKDPCYAPVLDPLSVRALVSALMSRTRGRHMRGLARSRRWAIFSWGVALVSVFCAGVGIGLALSGTS